MADEKPSLAPAGYEEFIAPERKEEKYGTPIEMAKTGAEGAASAASFGLSTKAETALGVPAEDIEARREVNPGSHMLGQAAGLVGSSFILPGGGAAGLLEGGGSLAARGAAAAAKLGGVNLAESAAARLGTAAVKQAVEGALFQTGDEVSKMFSSTKPMAPEALQTAAINVGLGGLLGAGFGAATGGVGELWNATTGARLGKALETAKSEIEGPALAPTVTSPTLQNNASELIPNLTPSAKAQEAAYGGGGAQIDPAQEAQAAADRLGVNLTEGTKSKLPIAKSLEANLSESPTFAGGQTQKEIAEMQGGVAKAAEDTLKERSAVSKYQNGEKIQKSVYKTAKDMLDPIEKGYKEIEPELSKVSLATDESPMHVRNEKDLGIEKLLDNPMVKEAPESATGKAYQTVAKEMQSLSSIRGIRAYRTDIGNKLSTALSQNGDKSLIPVYRDAKAILTDMITGSVKAAEDAGTVAEGTAEKLAALDAQYSEYKALMQKLGAEGGLGRVGTARELLEKLNNKASAESMEKRLLNPNDFATTQFFKEKFPEAAELARRGHLRDIHENSISTRQGENGKFSTAQYMKEINKLEPEARQTLFPGKDQTIKDIQTLHGRMSPKFNPTNSGNVARLANFLSPSGAFQELTDTAQRLFLKALPHLEQASNEAGGSGAALAAVKFAGSTEKGVDAGAFKQMSSYISATMKGESTLAKATSAIFDAGKDVLPSGLVPNQNERDKLDKKLKELQANSDPLMNVGDKVGHYLPDHGTALAQTAANGVNYLNSLRPNETPLSPLDGKPVISAAQKAEWQHALDIATQPLLVLKGVKDGSLTTTEMKTLHALYPALYQRMNEKLSNNLIEAKNKGVNLPYKTRMGLSLFMGQPLDSTMLPASIQATQMAAIPFTKPQSQQQPHMGGGEASALSKMAQSSMTPLQARQAASTKF